MDLHRIHTWARRARKADQRAGQRMRDDVNIVHRLRALSQRSVRSLTVSGCVSINSGGMVAQREHTSQTFISWSLVFIQSRAMRTQTDNSTHFLMRVFARLVRPSLIMDASCSSTIVPQESAPLKIVTFAPHSFRDFAFQTRFALNLLDGRCPCAAFFFFGCVLDPLSIDIVVDFEHRCTWLLRVCCQEKEVTPRLSNHGADVDDFCTVREEKVQRRRSR